MNWRDILSIKFADGGLQIHVGGLFLLLVAATIAFFYFRHRTKRYEVVSIELPLLGFPKFTIKPNNDVMQIAHQVWSELVTRKAGLQVDDEHDVIIEVYDSWYQLFGRVRESLRSVPAQLLRSDPSTRALVDLLVKALNEGLRPHLTQWQARFRKWFNKELQNHPEKSPQEIQKAYPHYDALLKDLMLANRQVVQLAHALKQIARGNS
jgi:hypothetical protein